MGAPLMDADEKEDPGKALRKSLGLRPRGRADSGAGDSKDADAKATASAEPYEAPPSAVPVKRSTSSKKGKKDAEPEAPPVDPRKKPTGKLPPEAQVALRNFYVCRPAIDLPPFLHELPGTMGRYFGDARPEREILVGWRPEFVLYLLPTYEHDKNPEWDKDEQQLVDPGLHEQPEATDRGFKVGETWNRPGESYIFIAWKADPEKKVEPKQEKKDEAAAGPRPGESQRDYDRRVLREKRERELAERKAARDAKSRSRSSREGKK